MKTSEKNKLRLVKMIEYLMRESDELHPVSVVNIQDYLKDEDISADRKTVYSDIQVINEYFMNIVTIKKSQNWYYCNERTFDLSELQMIVSAIVSAGFIDPKTSDEIIDKLYSLTSKNYVKEIKGNITIKNPSKHSNRDTLNSIDIIIEAIRKKKQISYDYIKHDVNSNIIVKHHKLTPVDLIYNDNYYYCVMAGNYEDDIRYYHIRIDRMRDVELLEDDQAIAHKYNSENYVKTHFQMWDGEMSWVTLEIKEGIIDSMYDKFGEKLLLKKLDDYTCEINVQVALSQAFYSWIMTFGDKIKIKTPEVKKEFLQYIAKIIGNYRNDED